MWQRSPARVSAQCCNMKNSEWLRSRVVPVLLFCLGLLTANRALCAVGDSATLLSTTIAAGAQVIPRTIFTQTWTFQNTGTNTWKSGQTGCTLNLLGMDNLGAIPMFTNTNSSWFLASAIIGSGKSIAPGAQAQFSMMFIAPEASGSVTDTFQLNGASGDYFGPQVTVQVNVKQAGSTNQYDRSRAISYANNYAGYVVSDGYFWTNGSDYYDFGALTPVPTAELGDDCAHFISSCIGSSNVRGGGLKIPTRVPPTYGEPGVARLVNTCLIGPGYATEVFSISQLEPGDVIAWNWEGDTNIANLDHATLYLGNNLLASHSASCLDMSPTFFQTPLTDWRWHLIHILDAPTITTTRVGNNFVLSWTTNWSSYTMYSATSLATNATWTKMTKSPTTSKGWNYMTNAMSTGPVFYRLLMP